MTLRIRALASAAALVAISAPAFAGGYAPAAAEPVVAAPVAVVTPVAASADWTGVSVGGQLAFGKLGLEQADVEDEFDGAIGGVHAGYSRDFGKIVAGGEVAYDWANLDAEDEDKQDLGTGVDAESMLRAGAKLGYDAGRFLPYAASGFSKGTFSDASGEETLDGVYYGAGVTYALTDRFDLGAEVLHHDFDTEIEGLDAGLTTFGVKASMRF